MENYTLYLDETKIWHKKSKPPSVYVVAGVVIRDSERKFINEKLTNFKDNTLGTAEVILHETDIRSARNKNVQRANLKYKKFEKNQIVKDTFNVVATLINNHCHVLGTIVNMSSLRENYHVDVSSYTSYYISLKIIMENYTKFLLDHHATGNIVLESRKTNTDKLDQRIRKQFYKIISHGTLRYSAVILQDTIKGISFIAKEENNNLLQLADFVPRPLALNYVNIKQSKPSIYQIIRKKRYWANNSPQDSKKYGVVVID